MSLRPALALSFVLALAACGPRYIRGTQIEDTDDTRAILQLMERYRAALEARDARGIQALLAPGFRDDAGTEDPSDDLTAQNAGTLLPQRLSKLADVHVELDVRRVEVSGEDAQAIYYWKAQYKLPRLNPKPQSESELEQMVFQRVGGTWKILSGI